MSEATAYDDLINLYAEQYGLDPSLLRRLVQQESGFNPTAVSPVGAQGLGQVMPATAADPGFGVRPLAAEDLMDPSENLRFSAEYFSAMLREFDGNERLALAAYNAGPGAVKKYGDVPPFEETQNYVRSILGGDGPTRPVMRPDREQASNKSFLDSLASGFQYLDLEQLGGAPRIPRSDLSVYRPRATGTGAQALKRLGIASLV
jgi:hypothetical protein